MVGGGGSGAEVDGADGVGVKAGVEEMRRGARVGGDSTSRMGSILSFFRKMFGELMECCNRRGGSEAVDSFLVTLLSFEVAGLKVSKEEEGWRSGESDILVRHTSGIETLMLDPPFESGVNVIVAPIASVTLRTITGAR